jgi:putative ABC transport system permease protein
MIDIVRADIRFALRTFRKAPIFAVAVLATIALAVCATTAIFAVVDNILLRPLPFPDSERAVALCETNPSTGSWCGASPMNVADWARSSSALEAAGVARPEAFIARDDTGSYAVMGGIVTAGFFDVLRVRPMLGRLIEQGDLPRGSNQVVVVSHQFWQQRLGGDRAAVGRSVVLDHVPFRVVGVLPAGVWMPDPFPDVQVWKPLTASIDNVENRGWRGFTALGRLAAGASQETLLSELTVIRSRLAAAYPDANQDWGLRIVNLREKTVGDVRRPLWIFLGMAGLVLLIAGANVAGLLLVRATSRSAEFALRASLGAVRRRLVLQLMIESLVLSLAGGAAGLVLAVWTTSGFVSIAPANIPRLTEVTIDGRIALFAFGLTTIIALIFGVAPAGRAWKTNVSDALKGQRSGTASDTRLRSAFTVVQVALAVVLVFGAGLLTRSFARLTRWDPGFDRANVVYTWVLPPKVGDTHATVALMEQLRDAVAALPGVQSASLGSAGPLFGGEETGAVAIEGRASDAAGRSRVARWFDVDPHYFATLGVRLIKGRQLSASDSFDSAPVAVVNDMLARQFFPGEDPLGRRLTVMNHPAQIVGVVADTKPLRPDESTPPQIYWPIEQYPRLAAYLILRTTTPGLAGVQKSVQARVAAVNGNVQLNPFVTLDERLARQLVTPRFNMFLAASFALVAVLLAGVGVYGVIAYSVASRTREFGVRVALGATPRQMVRGVLGRGLSLAFIGIFAGTIGALAVGRLLTSLLYGSSARDPLALIGAAAVLTLVALIAIWRPAHRASRVDPAVALRAE